jgi:RNA polymerase sigma factor (sigma-70 family)
LTVRLTVKYRSAARFIPKSLRFQEICDGFAENAGYGNKFLPVTVSQYDSLGPVPMNEEEKLTRFEGEMLPLMNDAYNLARWLMQNEHDARDMVQEAYLRAFKFFSGVRGETSRAWMLRIVRNVCYDYLKKRKVYSSDEELQNIPGDSSPEDELQVKSEIAAVRSALASLPEDFRTVLVLREMEELSYREISEITQVPIGTVMSRLARGRQQLAEALKQMREKDLV